MSAITNAQIRAIKAACRHHGIDDDTYRFMLDESYGAGSCKDLTRAQANDLLNRLNVHRRRKPVRRKPVQKAAAPAPATTSGDVVRLASPRQRQLIDQLVSEIRWRTSYEAWLRKSLGMSRVLTAADAQRVIPGLIRLKQYDGVGID